MPLSVDKFKLSIVIPNYNHSCYLEDALNAVLGQSFKPWEIIVIDDKSTDNSIEIIERFVKQNKSVKLIRNEKNIGVVNTLNLGLKYATGDYVHFPAADDKALPGLFEKSMKMFQLYPQAGLCCSDLIHFNDQKDSGRIKSFHLGEEACYLSPAELIRKMKRECIVVYSGSCVMKRSALIEAGGFIPELKWNCDWLAVYTLIFKYGLCYIPEPLAAQRILMSSYSTIGGNNWKSQKEISLNILRRLESPLYGDLLGVFKTTYSLAVFGMPMLSALISHKKYRKFISLVLALRMFRYEIRKFLGLRAPFFLKLIYYHLRKMKCTGY